MLQLLTNTSIWHFCCQGLHDTKEGPVLSYSSRTCRLVASTTRVDVRNADCSDNSAQAGSLVLPAAAVEVLELTSDDIRL